MSVIEWLFKKAVPCINRKYNIPLGENDRIDNYLLGVYKLYLALSTIILLIIISMFFGLFIFHITTQHPDDITKNMFLSLYVSHGQEYFFSMLTTLFVGWGGWSISYIIVSTKDAMVDIPYIRLQVLNEKRYKNLTVEPSV